MYFGQRGHVDTWTIRQALEKQNKAGVRTATTRGNHIRWDGPRKWCVVFALLHNCVVFALTGYRVVSVSASHSITLSVHQQIIY